MFNNELCVARQIAEMLRIELAGISNELSPTQTGTLVIVGVALGTVAVCVPVPIEIKAMFGPSFTILSVLPAAGNAVDVLAVVVTVTGSVSVGCENKSIFIFIPLAKKEPAHWRANGCWLSE